MELHGTVGTLADTSRRRPNSDTVRCRLRPRGFLTIPTFRLDLSPALAGLFYGALSPLRKIDAPSPHGRRTKSSGTKDIQRRF
jgi:hypothetical protein